MEQIKFVRERIWRSYEQLNIHDTSLAMLVRFLQGCYTIFECINWLESDLKDGDNIEVGERLHLIYFQGYTVLMHNNHTLLRNGLIIKSSSFFDIYYAHRPKFATTKEDLIAIMKEWNNIKSLHPMEIIITLKDGKVFFDGNKLRCPQPGETTYEGPETILFKKGSLNQYKMTEVYNTFLHTLGLFLERDFPSNSFLYLQWVQTVKEEGAVLEGNYYSLIYVEGNIIVSHTPYLLKEGIFTPTHCSCNHLDRHANCPKFITTKQKMLSILEAWNTILLTSHVNEVRITYEFFPDDEWEDGEDKIYDVVFNYDGKEIVT